ncbi:MAG TPA: tetratricopeptide repeat protein [Myxococcaceae bacterium]|nr:tetratricopeptide repeat protein [Myxococcaceae bacterium]
MPRTLPALLSALVLFPAAALADGPDLAKIDEAYAKRGDPASAKEVDALLAEAMKATPNDPQVLWRQARWNVWKADVLTGDAKKEMGKATWDLGDKIVKLDPKMVEGPFYGSLGVGQYSEGAGIVNALMQGLEGKFNDRLDKALQMNADVDRGGPMLTKGRYYFSLPWPKRDLTKSAEWYNKCLAKHPENARCHLYLAETLLEDGKAKEAKVHLDAALNAPEAYDPPEAVRVKGLAKKLQPKVEEKLK